MSVTILTGDCREVLRTLPDASVHCCVTSPPYFGLRDYGVAGQIGLEATPFDFVAEMVGVFREVRRVLREDGTLWLNLGDTYASNAGGYANEGLRGKTAVISNSAKNAVIPSRNRAVAGLKPKDLIGIPWRVAFALQADGWWLRSSIIWHKPNPIPESVTDRPTSAHKNLFLLAKSERYFYDSFSIREEPIGKNDHDLTGCSYSPPGQTARNGSRKRGLPPRHQRYVNSDRSGLDMISRDAGRNKRNVWTVATQPFNEAHFATFPPALIEPCIKAGCPVGGMVFDPFGGAGTTGLVADRLGRDATLIELNPEYAAMARRRIEADAGMFSTVCEAAE